jgi:hypothetical protein
MTTTTNTTDISPEPVGLPTSVTYNAKVSFRLLRGGMKALARTLWRETVIARRNAGRQDWSEERAQEIHEEHVDYMLRLQIAMERGEDATRALDPRWGCRPAKTDGMVKTPSADQLRAAMSE